MFVSNEERKKQEEEKEEEEESLPSLIDTFAIYF
jgi:hypothetical protein